MPAQKLRAIIFDIGRVLVALDVSAAMAGLAVPAHLTPQQVWVAIESHPCWRDWQEGRLSPREWHRQLSQRLGEGLAFEQFCEAWNRTLVSEPILPDELFPRLSRRFRLAVLSNTVPLHVAHLEAQFPVLGIFRSASSPAAWAPASRIRSSTKRSCGPAGSAPMRPCTLTMSRPMSKRRSAWAWTGSSLNPPRNAKQSLPRGVFLRPSRNLAGSENRSTREISGVAGKTQQAR